MAKKTYKSKSVKSSEKKASYSKETVVAEKASVSKNKWEVIRKMKLNNAVFLPGDKLSLPVDVVLPKNWAKLLTTKK